jgi:hypothetical protein
VKVIQYINQTLGRTQAKLAVNFVDSIADSITGSYMKEQMDTKPGVQRRKSRQVT